MMKLLISFALLAVAVQCDAQKWLDTITKPNGVFQNPLSSISNGFKKGIDAPAASTEGTTSASGATRSSSSSTAGGANPVGSGGMTNLFGFATNFNKNVTNGIGNFIKSPLSAMTNISNSIRDSIGGGINRTIESTTNMSMAVRDALTNSTGTLSDLGKNFAGMAGDAAFTRRELRALIGPSLRNSTGKFRNGSSVSEKTRKLIDHCREGLLFGSESLNMLLIGSLKDAVKKLVEAIDGGDSFGLLWAGELGCENHSLLPIPSRS